MCNARESIDFLAVGVMACNNFYLSISCVKCFSFHGNEQHQFSYQTTFYIIHKVNCYNKIQLPK